jgi:hypothetical protein
MDNSKFLLMGLLIQILFFSCSGPRSDQNRDNLKKVKNGMRLEIVEKIMGQPQSISMDSIDSENYVFRYGAPGILADRYRIYISRKDSIVVDIDQ